MNVAHKEEAVGRHGSAYRAVFCLPNNQKCQHWPYQTIMLGTSYFRCFACPELRLFSTRHAVVLDAATQQSCRPRNEQNYLPSTSCSAMSSGVIPSSFSMFLHWLVRRCIDATIWHHQICELFASGILQQSTKEWSSSKEASKDIKTKDPWRTSEMETILCLICFIFVGCTGMESKSEAVRQICTVGNEHLHQGLESCERLEHAIYDLFCFAVYIVIKGMWKDTFLATQRHAWRFLFHVVCKPLGQAMYRPNVVALMQAWSCRPRGKNQTGCLSSTNI